MDAKGSHVRLDRVEKRYPGGTLAVTDFSLTVPAGEFVSLLGPSGCGKSTILRLVAGLDRPSAGTVDAPAQRDAAGTTAYVFQEPTLMPWASVFDNVWLPLRLAGVGRAAASAPVSALLQTVGLGDFAQSLPQALSGGMRMRTSIARALVTQPRILLMDEPFAAVDEITRGRLNLDLLAWWQARRLSVIFVTHSVYEAAFLSQRVVVMGARPGRIVREVVIDEPYPRGLEYRLSTAYQNSCREIAAALDLAFPGAGA
jgi:NitT/TauT family transport system ATP-binding protein